MMRRPEAGLGERLRLAREAAELTVADVAATTRISTRALIAIEDERFDDLPGGIFRRTFVQAYAEAVGLDGVECARLYVARFEPPAPSGADGDPSEWPQAAVALVVAIVLAVMLAGIVVFTV
jgi:cytoskeletal protein RodZ